MSAGDLRSAFRGAVDDPFTYFVFVPKREYDIAFQRLEEVKTQRKESYGKRAC
jgi:hypothetical protein